MEKVDFSKAPKDILETIYRIIRHIKDNLSQKDAEYEPVRSAKKNKKNEEEIAQLKMQLEMFNLGTTPFTRLNGYAKKCEEMMEKNGDIGGNRSVILMVFNQDQNDENYETNYNLESEYYSNVKKFIIDSAD